MKLVTLAVACMLAAVAVVPATAAPEDGRNLSYDYQGGDAFTVEDFWLGIEDGNTFLAQPRQDERFVTVEVTDQTGRPVMAAAHQANKELGPAFCESSGRLKLMTRKPIHVHLFTSPGCGDISVPIQGTVTLTFE